MATDAAPKQPKSFDFSRYKQRHICLNIAYLGWDCEGFVVQENTTKTIEADLFSALDKTKLIPSRETACYHRCGRTDKGVSAFSQVISINVRSNHSSGPGIFPFVFTPAADSIPCEGSNKASHAEEPSCSSINETSASADISSSLLETLDESKELDYPRLLNRVLPPHIRVTAWARVPPEFSARFDCKERTYKYYFPRGKLNVDQMMDACELFVGVHDFRNFCKMDVASGKKEYVREMKRVHIDLVSTDDANQTDVESSYDLFSLTIVANAFAWHQIRCIVSILFLVGEEKEPPSIITELFNVDCYPCKPQYPIAADFPLNLYDCQFDNIQWITSSNDLTLVIKHFQTIWTELTCKSQMVRAMLSSLEQSADVSKSNVMANLNDCLIPGNKPKRYTSLLKRPTGDSLETKIEKANQRKMRRLDDWIPD